MHISLRFCEHDNKLFRMQTSREFDWDKALLPWPISSQEAM